MDNLLYAQAFENKLNKSYGYEFQAIFFEIMKNIYKDDFIMPRPQGRLGDKKNDGYIPSIGEYFAVYGPETADLNISYTVQKLETDFTGLMHNIESGEWTKPINKFTYVVNTRFQNLFPTEIVQKADELSSKYSISITLMSSYDIKQKFNELTTENKKLILQMYISLDEMSLNVPILNGLIDKIYDRDYQRSKIDGLMDFEEKIKFNNLNYDRYIDLINASYSINSLDSALNNLDPTGTTQEQLGSLLKNIYEDGKKKYIYENDIFDYLVEELIGDCSNNLSSVDYKVVRETVLIIISKYFENCTVFEKSKVIES